MLNYREDLDNIPMYDTSDKCWNIKLNANECNINVPPLVYERILSRLSNVCFNRYPNEEYDILRDEIAKSYSLCKDNVLLGNGSSEIIEKVFWCFGGTKSHKVVIPYPSFSMYDTYAYIANFTIIHLNYNDDFSFDRYKFVNTVNDQQATLAIICNPNNPTGMSITLADIEYIASNISCALLIDEAYMEFYNHSSISLISRYPHIMVTRTFSKAYALASCRVGYIIADTNVIQHLKKAFMPYHMNVLSLTAADTVFQMRYEYEPIISNILIERERIFHELVNIPGLVTYRSDANFLLLRLSTNKITDLIQRFEYIGIGIRIFNNNTVLQNHCRISIGLPNENDIWLNELRNLMGE